MGQVSCHCARDINDRRPTITLSCAPETNKNKSNHKKIIKISRFEETSIIVLSYMRCYN